MSTPEIITYNDIQRLLADSTEIIKDWDTYTRFQKNRDAVLERLALIESKN